jgi:hypothetical protein
VRLGTGKPAGAARDRQAGRCGTGARAGRCDSRGRGREQTTLIASREAGSNMGCVPVGWGQTSFWLAHRVRSASDPWSAVCTLDLTRGDTPSRGTRRSQTRGRAATAAEPRRPLVRAARRVPQPLVATGPAPPRQNPSRRQPYRYGTVSPRFIDSNPRLQAAAARSDPGLTRPVRRALSANETHEFRNCATVPLRHSSVP